ncbi:MAG: GxxExxY protein [Candidatus Aminicenantes bacterium]|nr:GxxExxY protein [Candidatus Aminicenantes bacterium]
MIVKLELNELTDKIIGSAIEVHRELGPGLLESAYEACLFFELAQAGLKVERQKALPVYYKSIRIDCGYRLDLLVEDQIIVELKSIEALLPIHKAQLISYLRMSGCSVGLLINFNVALLKDGLQRIVNQFQEPQRVQRLQRLKND